MRQRRVEAVVHFAAFIAVGESMREPGPISPTTWRDRCPCSAPWWKLASVTVFSSTAAVYGPAVSPSPRPSRFTRSIPTANRRSWSRRSCAGRRDSPPHQRLPALFQRLRRRPEGRLARSTNPKPPHPAGCLRPLLTWPAGHHIRRTITTPHDGTCIRDYSRGRSGPGPHPGLDHLLAARLRAVQCRYRKRPQRARNAPRGGGSHRAPVPYVMGPRREGDRRGWCVPRKLRASWVGARTAAADHCGARLEVASKQGG